MEPIKTYNKGQFNKPKAVIMKKALTVQNIGKFADIPFEDVAFFLNDIADSFERISITVSMPKSKTTDREIDPRYANIPTVIGYIEKFNVEDCTFEIKVLPKFEQIAKFTKEIIPQVIGKKDQDGKSIIVKILRFDLV